MFINNNNKEKIVTAYLLTEIFILREIFTDGVGTIHEVNVDPRQQAHKAHSTTKSTSKQVRKSSIIKNLKYLHMYLLI